ncbi:hypothetical protein [Dactylosporangium sp. NPDC050588]|uniref:hypothetical protein n=1 Tax=Dactylosporangium sp. NPDC050588 TaxID=3157211 RepID=UPI0034026237
MHPHTAYRWFREGTLPVPAARVGPRTILVNVDAAAAVRESSVSVGLYARVSSHDQKEHRDRLGRVNTELVEAALTAAGRRLVVLDADEVDDVVRDVVEVLTAFCARLYGRRSARSRVLKALEAAAGGG